VNDGSNLLLVTSVIVMRVCCVGVGGCGEVGMWRCAGRSVVCLCICLCCVRANIPPRTRGTTPHGTNSPAHLQIIYMACEFVWREGVAIRFRPHVIFPAAQNSVLQGKCNGLVSKNITAYRKKKDLLVWYDS